MESLLLFRRALASPTMCRFIPALSVPHTFPHVLRQLMVNPDRIAPDCPVWRRSALEPWACTKLLTRRNFIFYS
jgi:hypothetical protein